MTYIFVSICKITVYSKSILSRLAMYLKSLKSYINMVKIYNYEMIEDKNDNGNPASGHEVNCID